MLILDGRKLHAFSCKKLSKHHFIILFLAFTVIITCKRDSAQEQFEREAFAQPENITRTDANANILSNDPDDWRIAPLFQSFVEINAPAYANPSIGLRFTIEILITGLEAVSGLEIYTRDNFGRPYIIYTDNRRPLPPGIIDIYIDPTWLTPTRIYSNAIGLHRIFIYDYSGNMITYGDLLVE
jgi:hypothetical protein